MPLSLQKKLISFLKNKRTLKIGGKSPFKSDVRIIATSKIFQDRLETGKVSEELLYYFNTVVINVTSLRDRDEDILILADHFLNDKNSYGKKKILSKEVKKILLGYFWPGNVRELKNVISKAKFIADGVMIEKNHLPSYLNRRERSTEETSDGFVERRLADVEKGHICNTLEHLNGNKSRAAVSMGITVKTLYNKLHRYGMMEEEK